MILNEYQEQLVLNKLASRHNQLLESVELKDHEQSWRAINCICDILTVLMFLEAITICEYNILCDGIRDKF